ncbi:hypothetical protein ES703_102688 [subsurface metagenome]
MTHIHLCTIKTGPRRWAITTTDVRAKMWPKYEKAKPEGEKAMENWLEDMGLKRKESGSD